MNGGASTRYPQFDTAQLNAARFFHFYAFCTNGGAEPHKR
jgi:hypothetical protein